LHFTPPGRPLLNIRERVRHITYHINDNMALIYDELSDPLDGLIQPYSEELAPPIRAEATQSTMDALLYLIDIAL
jgi:hypothetical protein